MEENNKKFQKTGGFGAVVQIEEKILNDKYKSQKSHYPEI